MILGVQPKMRKVGIWVSGLLASAIPFFFVGAVIALLACVFDAVGVHRPTAPRASFQAEAAPTEQVVATASADAPDDVAQRQAGKDTRGDTRRHQASRFGSHPRVRHTSRFAKHLANEPRNKSHNEAIW
jgi:hypothetical protein